MEIVDGRFPVDLDGTSVTVNGQAAAVESIQPSQANIETPDDTAIGPVQVIVYTAAGTTNSFTVNYARFAPGLFVASAPYIVAQHADNHYVTTASPAKPGEVIILWGTGFGPANPAVPAGQVFSGANPLVNNVTVTIGGQSAQVDFAGVVGAGLVQIKCACAVQHQQRRCCRRGYGRRCVDADYCEHDLCPQLVASWESGVPTWDRISAVDLLVKNHKSALQGAETVCFAGVADHKKRWSAPRKGSADNWWLKRLA